MHTKENRDITAERWHSLSRDRQRDVGVLLESMLAVFVFRFLLDVSYALCVVPFYSYLYPFQFDPSGDALALSWTFLLVFTPLCFVTYRKGRPSDILVTILYLVSYVPTSSLIAFQGFDSQFIFSINLFWLIFLCANCVIGNIELGDIRSSTRIGATWLAVALLCIAVVFVSWKYTGFRINLNLSSVYEMRMEAREYSLPFPFTYLIGASRLILPLASVFLLWKRRFALFGCLAIVQVLLFSIDGSKSALFSLVLMIVSYYLVRKPSTGLVAKLFLFVVLVCLLVFLVTGRTELLSYAVRRMMYLPALLHGEYYDFFSSHPHDFYIQSIFSKFGFDSPYTTSIPHVVAEFYHGSTTMSANNGLFSDAYANLGLIGCIVLPVAYIGLFRLIDACSQGLPMRVVFPALIPVALTLLSSSFFTVLISHGLMFYILVLYLLPRSGGLPCQPQNAFIVFSNSGEVRRVEQVYQKAK